MRQHLVTVILVVLFVTTLFSVWLVQFFAAQFESSRSGQLSEVHGLVEFQVNNEEWQTAFPGQRVNPGMQVRVTTDSSATLSFNATSRLTLQPETELKYLGYVNGQPNWLLLGGTINGRYVSASKPLLLTIDESTIAINIATFKAVNMLDQQYVTVFDQSVTVSSTKIADIDQIEKTDAILVSAGETYQLTAGSVTASAEEISPTPTEEAIISTNSATITPQPTPASTPLITKPSSTIKLTLGQPDPLTFIWIDQSIQNQPGGGTTKNNASFRLMRGTDQTVDETSAAAYRTVSGQNLSSYKWPLPDTKTTYYFRVCRLSGKTCAAYSNTLTFLPAQN